jgi:hypothetical protein
MLSACAAVTHKKFSEPNGDFSVTYPSGWQPSWGIQTLNFYHPAGREVRIGIGGYPSNREDPPTAEVYIESALSSAKLYGSQIDRNGKITISGNPATRLEYSSKQSWVDRHDQKTSDRMFSVVQVVVPHGAHYHVLSMSGLSEDAAAIMPEFDRMVAGFRLGSVRHSLAEWSGIYDGPLEARMMVARNPEELQKMLWFFGEPVKKLIPEEGFDFTNSLLAGISLGQKSTGGYSVRIEGSREKDGVLFIRYREGRPGSGSIVTQALTAPYHLKVLPAGSAKSVRFENIDQPDKSKYVTQ